jgi:hypothetical protein
MRISYAKDRLISKAACKSQARFWLHTSALLHSARDHHEIEIFE